MGNASETFLFVSKISKSNDLLIGVLYTVFGKRPPPPQLGSV